jgi:hypothetical protein
MSKCDLVAGALAVSLKIQQEHRISQPVQELGPGKHIESTAAHSMEQQHYPLPGCPGAQPAMYCRARPAPERHRMSRQIRRRLSHRAWSWGDKLTANDPGEGETHEKRSSNPYRDCSSRCSGHE